MSILGILALSFLQSQTAPTPANPPAKGVPSQTKTFFEYRDTERGLTLKMENGRVELTAPSEDAKGSRTTSYKADSLAEFKHRYPEIAKKYDLDRLLPKSMTPEAAESWWSEWTKRLGGDEEDFVRRHMGDLFKNGPEPLKDLDRWFDDEHQRLRDMERRLHDEGVQVEAEPSPHHGIRFGVLVAPVGEALRAQLGLKPSEGLIVSAVEKGSMADTSGLKQYDVLLKLSGQIIADPSHFRDQVVSALQSKDFVLEVLRRGNPLKLIVHPTHS